MQKYDKPYKTTDQLLELLSTRGVKISDWDFAKTAIESHSYYTIVNGYKGTFLTEDGLSYIDGTTFSDLYNLHMIDTDLSSILFKYILFAERELKNRISQMIASKYGVYTDISDKSNNNKDDYLFRNYYHACEKRNNILLRIKNSMDPNESKYINAIVMHYATNHNHIPPWIMVTNIPLGMAIEWYYILKPNDKLQICNQFIPSDTGFSDESREEFLLQSFRILKKYRNDIAHGYRVFNCITSDQLSKNYAVYFSRGTLTKSEYKSGYGRSDIYALAIIINSLINDKNVLHNFYNDMYSFFVQYNSTVLAGHTLSEALRIPADFVMRLDTIHKKSV